MLRIESWLELWLPTQPEYRMGYQKVVATLNTGGTEHGIIVNSKVFLKDGEYPWQMHMSDLSYAENEARKSPLYVKNVQLIPRAPETLRGVRQIVLAKEKNRVLANRKSIEATYARVSGSPRYTQLCAESQNFANIAASAAAEDAPITLTELAEIFKRFSAYANDNRVTPGMGLTPNTFATSKPASNVFTITPAQDTEVKRGTTQPANNQPGGGVEVIFVKGLPDGTVTGPVTIPDK
jgi:hypothetical protein